MSWFSDMLMSLFPPEPFKDDPAANQDTLHKNSALASDDFKRYHKFLGERNHLRWNAGGMEMMDERGGPWRRVTPLSEWLRKYPQRGVTPP